MELVNTCQSGVNVTISNTQGDILASGHNKTVAVGLNMLAQLFMQGATTSTISYCALGTGTTAPSTNDTILTAESVRSVFTTTAIVNSSVICQTFFPATTCSINVQELGVFGNGATATSGSGTLFAHVLSSYSNTTSPVDLVVSWSISFSSAD